jgi:hypothetical protein
MLKSDVEYFMNNWGSGVAKIFRWRRPFVPDEYVSIFINESGLFKTDAAVSTATTGLLKRDEIMHMIMNEELVFQKNYDHFTNLTLLKTGGCECGAWAIPGHENLHTLACPQKHHNYSAVKK